MRIRWTHDFAYAIGLLTTDGSLSIDGRHINFTSKDRELVELFGRCLRLTNRIGRKSRAKEKSKKYFQIQFGDVLFYKFLLGIGLTPRKSKTLSSVDIPEQYFFDFLRGHFDGDGTFYSYWDKRWKSSFMFYTVFISASLAHILWLRKEIERLLGIRGHITHDGRRITHHLKYAKKDSLAILPRLYRDKKICLQRKRLKIEKVLAIIEKPI